MVPQPATQARELTRLSPQYPQRGVRGGKGVAVPNLHQLLTRAASAVPQVQDGDMIDVDVGKKAMTLELSEEELKARRDAWNAPPLKATQGTLFKYCKLVSSASMGCVTDM